ncbi:MAG: VWA domain-containing protein [Acidobacteriia bacterium]|nr:VWA domain-containing protein [Terriglobia bacterium]
MILLPGARPQQQEQKPAEDISPTIQVEVNLVSLLASVRDKHNALISNLTKDDFTLTEDGQTQTIKYFTRETDLPLTIGLLVDVSASQRNLIDIEREAAYQFFSQVLRKKDMAFLISFGEEAELLQDFTGSPRLLQAGLSQLRVNSGVQGVHPGPVPTIGQPRGTVLYDAVYLAATDRMTHEVGRKAMVLITDGMDEGSRLKIDEAIKSAQKADTVIYSIYYVDPRAYYGRGYFGGVSDSALRRMSEETGGRVFRVDRKHTLPEVFKELQDEMRSQYAISYTPTNEKKDGTFRRVDLRTTDHNLKVQVRKGYYASGAEK